LLHRHYYDYGPTFASEKLATSHRLKRDPKTIRQIMIEQKLWQPKKKKNGSEYRAWRQRKANYGEMVQFDGSYEHWFENRAPQCCLLAAIDDATGRIIRAKFNQHEGVFPVFDFWLEYLEKHGKPRSIYLDKFSTYKMNQRVALENHDLKTQFERATAQLQIETISAHSPQAKGRVERLFGTLQDRLIKELRLSNISTLAAANEFLAKVFIPQFNTKFSVKPLSETNLHGQLALTERKQLKSIFSRQTERTIQNDFTLSFKNQWYQLTKEQPATVCKKDKIIVEEHIDGCIQIRLRGKYLNYQLLPVRPQKQVQPWVLAATAQTPKRHFAPAYSSVANTYVGHL
jgi:transposase-like protein